MTMRRATQISIDILFNDDEGADDILQLLENAGYIVLGIDEENISHCYRHTGLLDEEE